MSERICGECTYCCKVMAIDELKKPPTQWCPHAEINKGCNIYANRPDSCRKFRCMWLDDMCQPEAMRPDKTRVIFVARLNRVQVHVDPDRPDAWKQGLPAVYITLLRKTGIDILLVCGNKKKMRTQYEREHDHEKNLPR